MNKGNINIYSPLWKRMVGYIPALFVLAGLTMVVIFGWSYLRQTVFINYINSPVYQPSFGTGKLWNPTPDDGSKIGDLIFPSLNLNVPVVQGTDSNSLKQGVGHYVKSALPGQGGKVYLAGHRDTVFIKLKNLKIGEKIEFSTPYGIFVYEVTGFKIVTPNDTSVLEPTNYETLTLQTCYPFTFIGDAPDRYIVFTKFVSQQQIPVADSKQK